jgi:pyrrolysine biosynthesis protein PylC
MEIIGDGINFILLPITEVVTDSVYDCKRIVAPAKISDGERTQFLDIGRALAENLMINGIFDIEVISHKGKLKLLEIDARFPSQTPISVYHATGINMVKALTEMKLKISNGVPQAHERICLYQQILVKNRRARIVGEHMISGLGRLKHIEGFFGANETLTDYIPGVNTWAAILIITADTYKDAFGAFDICVENIRRDSLCPD